MHSLKGNKSLFSGKIVMRTIKSMRQIREEFIAEKKTMLTWTKDGKSDLNH